MPGERKPKRLSEHDVQEVVQFQRYLNDIGDWKSGAMSTREYVTKWQAYMGLSDAEAEAYIAREESR